MLREKDMAMIIAHRGASAYERENTMAAFRAAAALGCDGLETDVQLSADGVPVLIHDETVDRTTVATGWVRDHTFADLAALGVPSLEQLLSYAADVGLTLNLELKNSVINYPGLEEKTLTLVRAYGLVDSTILSSFNHRSMVACKRIDPAVKTGLLCFATLWQPWDYCSRTGADAYHPHFSGVDEEVVYECRQAGVSVNPWTVNAEADIERMVALDVDMIISDYPDRVRERIGDTRRAAR